MDSISLSEKVLRVLGILLVFLFLIGIISTVGEAIVPYLRDYSESQERKDVYRFMCSRTSSFSDFCYYDESNNNWRYRPIPKTEQELESITPEEKFFTSKEECVDFCYKDWLETEKSSKEELLSKEMVEGFQESYPEFQKSFWHKLSNWLEKL